jgi:hypothetical protein
MESTVPRDRPHDKRMIIWSPNSLEFGNEADSEEEGFGRSWDRTVAYVKFEDFNRTVSSLASKHHVGDESSQSISTMAGEGSQPAEPSTPHSSLWESQEDGMVPLVESLRTDVILDKGTLPTRESSGTRETANSTQSKMVTRREIRNVQVLEAERSRGNDHLQDAPLARSFAGGSSSNGDEANVDNSGKYLDLIKALLKAGNGQVGVWVDFEAARKLVGNNATVKALGFPSYTSMVKEAHDHHVIERRWNQNGTYIRLLPPSSVLNVRLDPKVSLTFSISISLW